jgi:hypothetical protein
MDLLVSFSDGTFSTFTIGSIDEHIKKGGYSVEVVFLELRQKN